MKRHLGVLAAYAALTILLTWPLAAQFTQAVPGGGDAWQHLWNLWWMRTALVDLHTDPFYTTDLYYPQGVSLLFHTLVPLEGLLTIPFQLAGVDLVPLYNGVLALSFILAGYGTWLLVRDLTGADGAAFVAGSAFAFCPYHMGHLLGHMNLASLQWIPFYLWALCRACGPPGTPVVGSRQYAVGSDEESGVRSPESESHAIRNMQHGANSKLKTQNSLLPTAYRLLPTIGWAALAGVFLAANAFTEWIYVAFLGVFTAGYLAWRLVVDGGLRRGPGRGWDGALLWAGRLLVLGAVFGVLAGPLAWRMAREQHGQDWMKLPPRETLVYSSDLVDSFVPPALHPFWPGPAQALQRRFPERNPAERAVFLGYTPIVLAALAVGIGRGRRRAAIFWGLVAAAAWLLSLGPILHVMNRSTFTPFNTTIPLPYLVFYTLVPGFSVMRVPARFVVLASLALAVGTGYALAAIRARWLPAPPARRTVVLYGGALALIAGEFLAVPYPMAAPGYHIAFYAEVARLPDRFAILELPLRPMADYLAYQTVHGKPIVYGYLSRQPPDPFVDGTPVIHYLLNSTPVDALSSTDASAGAQALRTANVRYVVVHWWALTDVQARALQTKLSTIFPGHPPREDPANQISIYTVGP